MNAVDIVVKKRDGGELSPDEIHFFIQGYTNGTIPDYQASALLMAYPATRATNRARSPSGCRPTPHDIRHPSNHPARPPESDPLPGA